MKFVRLFSLAVLLVSAPGALLSQDAEQGYIQIRVQTVKPDSAAEWTSLRATMRDAIREAGGGFYHVYQRVRGPLNVYLIVSPATSIGEPSMPVGPTGDLSVPDSWFSAMANTLDNQSLVTLETNSAWSTLSLDGPRAPGDEYAHVRIRTAAAGRGGDFEEWLSEQLVPGLQEAGAGDVRTARVVLGGSPRTFVTFSFVPGWPEPMVPLDSRVVDRMAELVSSQTDYFYRYREDLSFTN